MPTDAQFPFGTDQTGDIATVEGDHFYYRHALQLGLAVAAEYDGQGLTANQELEFVEDLQSTLAASPYFEEPITVESIGGTDAGPETLRATIHISNFDTFEIPLEVSDE